ncbi:LysR substrate-binding domain-containing protein [Falsiroseomonas selenitidurans]|uniref:LysR family transcriptional regulator n=1 Tax=Falsiroseomonas selenitidurans TaxID=2716335 RepID=A0ABX1E4R4_9PROT|nr:LysR substrate-binding domain-containing protein [Falsiroseomonas selenitidurans]NKC31986.1 LysR family transcriptional regulator [Falsiroseomonas selenitidurans]
MSLPQGVSALPLQALRAFDAAARHLNMARAAEELGVTQGAISRQVKSLEAQLAETLFLRGPRGLKLTEAGDLLADYVRRGLEQLEAGLFRIGQPRSRTTLVVNAARTFAMRVLAPRIAGFAREHPWIAMRLETHRYFAQLHGADVDVAIRAGNGDWPGHVVRPLTREVLFPVCAPTHAAVDLPAEDAIRRGPLLHYAERPHWRDWLLAAGLDPALASPGPRFDETALTLAAAEAGQGLAVGWGVLVADAIAAGRLVRPFRQVLDDGTGYHLVMTEMAARRSTVQAFCTWLHGALATQPSAPPAVEPTSRGGSEDASRPATQRPAGGG